MFTLAMDRFIRSQMDITVYIAQIENHCMPYNIKPEKKVNLFLANISHELFSQLRDLFLPQELSEQTFETIKNTLTDHFQPRSNIIVGRFKFHSLRQTAV